MKAARGTIRRSCFQTSRRFSGVLESYRSSPNATPYLDSYSGRNQPGCVIPFSYGQQREEEIYIDLYLAFSHRDGRYRTAGSTVDRRGTVDARGGDLAVPTPVVEIGRHCGRLVRLPGLLV